MWSRGDPSCLFNTPTLPHSTGRALREGLINMRGAGGGAVRDRVCSRTAPSDSPSQSEAERRNAGQGAKGGGTGEKPRGGGKAGIPANESGLLGFLSRSVPASRGLSSSSSFLWPERNRIPFPVLKDEVSIWKSRGGKRLPRLFSTGTGEKERGGGVREKRGKLPRISFLRIINF